MLIGAPLTQAQTCALYGASTYTNSWLGINYLIVLAGLFLVAFVYMLSKFMPANVRGRTVAMTRVEIAELLTSVIIITALLAFSSVACNVSLGLSKSATGTPLSPFFYADQYIGNLTFNTGLRLLTNVYALSIGYAVDARLWTTTASILANLISAPELTAGVVTVSFPFGYDLGIVYSAISGLFLDLLAPLIVVALGTLFVQWLLIPLIQATAFVIVLPIAIAMRSLPFSGAGGGLRSAANAVLAVAIAAYIVYPLMVAFNPCIVSWIYGQRSCLGPANSNPSAAYLPSYGLSSIPTGVFSTLSSNSSSSIKIGGLPVSTPALSSFINTAFGFGAGSLNPFNVLTPVQGIINLMAQFIFQAVILFALDLAITVGFAMGLTNALNAGIGGPAQFWMS